MYITSLIYVHMYLVAHSIIIGVYKYVHFNIIPCVLRVGMGVDR